MLRVVKEMVTSNSVTSSSSSVSLYHKTDDVGTCCKDQIDILLECGDNFQAKDAVLVIAHLFVGQNKMEKFLNEFKKFNN